MLAGLFGSESRRAQKLLEEVDLLSSDAVTDFNDLFLSVRRHVILSKAEIGPFVKAMRRSV